MVTELHVNEAAFEILQELRQKFDTIATNQLTYKRQTSPFILRDGLEASQHVGRHDYVAVVANARRELALDAVLGDGEIRYGSPHGRGVDSGHQLGDL